MLSEIQRIQRFQDLADLARLPLRVASTADPTEAALALSVAH